MEKSNKKKLENYKEKINDSLCNLKEYPMADFKKIEDTEIQKMLIYGVEPHFAARFILDNPSPFVFNLQEFLNKKYW